MNGIGMSELLLIGVLILLFFGSKELPRIMRELGSITSKVRRYSDKIRSEITLADEPPALSHPPAAQAKKAALRKEYLARRKALTPSEHAEKSAAICEHLLNLPEYVAARAVMAYYPLGAEVAIHEFIQQALTTGKRIILPFVPENTTNLGIAAIADLSADLQNGTFGTMEPRAELRNNFFKSDLSCIICPGVAFDTSGGRLGRGKSYYDNFLKEIKGKIPLIGIAFANQILLEHVPFEYHDIPMDIIITENGVIYNRGSALPQSES